MPRDRRLPLTRVDLHYDSVARRDIADAASLEHVLAQETILPMTNHVRGIASSTNGTGCGCGSLGVAALVVVGLCLLVLRKFQRRAAEQRRAEAPGQSMVEKV